MKVSSRDKRLFALAESLIQDIEQADMPLQPEDLMPWLASHVPSTEREDAEFAEELDEITPRQAQGKSAINRLRKALGFAEGTSLLMVIEMAAEVCEGMQQSQSKRDGK